MDSTSTSSSPKAKRIKLSNEGAVAKVDANRPSTCTNDACDQDEVVQLCEDALVHVMEFLGPMDLLRMILTSKFLRENITTSIVVKSAMIHVGKGGNSWDMAKNTVRLCTN